MTADGTKTHVYRGKSAHRRSEPVRLANYVGGMWRAIDGVDMLDDIDPATGEVAALVPLSGAAEVRKAVEAAQAAQPAWREVPPQRRARALLALRGELLRRREELVALVSTDMGKTLADADGEVGRGIESVESAAAMPHLLKGETLEGVAAGVDVELVRQPVGVVAAITPFNFPAMIPLWFLPYAIACGNVVPAEALRAGPAAGGADRRGRRLDRRDPARGGQPRPRRTGGGDGDPRGPRHRRRLLRRPGRDGADVAEGAVRTGKRVQALGGAKNSLVVMPDADLVQAVPAILGSAFGAAGQRCLAGSVCVVVGEKARRAEVSEALVAATRELKLGPGADPATDVCPMISAAARQRIAEAIERGAGEGAELLLDGRGDPGPAGTMLGPTIAAVSDRESELAREELFGPLLTVVGVPGLDAALEFLNGSRYGNAGAIFTRSGEAARRYRHGAEAGMLGVNVGVPAPVAWFPFAGWKDSCDGDLHANGSDAVDFYTRKKVVTSRW